MLHIYETVVVLSPDLDDEAVRAHTESLKNTLAEWGGVIESIDLWGRRHLEYEIKRKREGVYYVVLYKIDTANNPIAKIDRAMILDESVLRHLSVRRDDLMKARAKKMRDKREQRREKREARARAEAEAAAQRSADAIARAEAQQDARMEAQQEAASAAAAAAASEDADI